MRSTPRKRFRQLQEQGGDLLLTLKANQATLHRQIRSQFQGKCQIPFMAMDSEISHRRKITWTLRAKLAPMHIREACSDTTWIVDLHANCMSDAQPFEARYLFVTG